MTGTLSRQPGAHFTAPATCRRDSSTVAMKTRGEIEAASCDLVRRLVHEYMGRGPGDIRRHLIGDLLVVRLQNGLTAAEKQLVKPLATDKGRDLLKQVRTQLIETARPLLEEVIRDVTGAKVLSMHHDISTLTGEEVVLFTLAESPQCRAQQTPGLRIGIRMKQVRCQPDRRVIRSVGVGEVLLHGTSTSIRPTRHEPSPGRTPTSRAKC